MHVGMKQSLHNNFSCLFCSGCNFEFLVEAYKTIFISCMYVWLVGDGSAKQG